MVPKWETMIQKMHLWIFADSYWFRQGNISTDVNIHETSVRSGRVQKTSMRGGTLGRWLPDARIVEELLSQTWCLLHPTLNEMWIFPPFASSKMTGEGGKLAWCSWRSECWRSNVSEVISCEIMRNVPPKYPREHMHTHNLPVCRAWSNIFHQNLTGINFPHLSLKPFIFWAVHCERTELILF